MTLFLIKLKTKIDKIFSHKLVAVILGIILSIGVSTVAFAADKVAEPSAKGVTDYLLNEWFLYILLFYVVYLVGKECISGRWLPAVGYLVVAALLYALIKDPAGMLEKISGLKSKVGL